MRSGVRSTVVILIIAAFYLAWRPPHCIVWDDTSWASFNRYSNGGHYSFQNPRFFPDLLGESFGQIQIDGYRPFNAIIRGTGAAWFADTNANPWPFFLLTGLLLGLLAVLAFWVARGFTQTSLAAALAVFLFLASTPMLTGSLVVFAGIQAFVPILICSAWLTYQRSLISSRPWLWRGLLFLILFLSPWFREFTGVMPVLIIVRELQRTRRPTPAMSLSGVAFLQALFPTALVHLLFFKNLPVVPIHRLGNLAATLNHGGPAHSWKEALKQLHWRIWLDLPSILPPTLFLLALLGLVLCLSRRTEQTVRFWNDVAFLGFFFLTTFLPFLKLFNEQVHLAYCLLPLSILLMMLVEQAWNFASGRGWRTVLAVAMTVVLMDHAASFYAVRGATGAIYASIHRLAVWFQTQTPAGTVVICNAHHIEDVRYYCHGHIDLLATAPGVIDRNRWVHTPELLRAALRARPGRDVYLLDARLPVSGGQRGADRAHYILAERLLPVGEPIPVEGVRFVYPIFDPLRLLTPLKTMNWPGPPDLEFDFYRGPALSGRWMVREIALDYVLVKSEGSRLDVEN